MQTNLRGTALDFSKKGGKEEKGGRGDIEIGGVYYKNFPVPGINIQNKNKQSFPLRGNDGAPKGAPQGPAYRNVRDLERLWVRATQNAFAVRRYAMLPVAEQALSSDRLSLSRRFTDFTRLVSRLAEWDVSPREFVTAIFEHHRRWCGRIPNVRQVAGEWGRGIWLRWRAARAGESLDPAARTEAAAKAGTESKAERFGADLRRAYAECRELGPDAATLSWGAEVLWALAKTEPPMSAVIHALLREAAFDSGRRDLALAVATEIRAIWRDAVRQRMILGLRRRITGAPPWRALLGEGGREETAMPETESVGMATPSGAGERKVAAPACCHCACRDLSCVTLYRRNADGGHVHYAARPCPSGGVRCRRDPPALARAGKAG